MAMRMLALRGAAHTALVIPYSASGVQISTWPCQRLRWLHAGSHMTVVIEDEFERPHKPSNGIGPSRIGSASILIVN
jgi:hypothetical protein